MVRQLNKKSNDGEPLLWRTDITIFIIFILVVIGIILSQLYVNEKTPWDIQKDTFLNFISTELSTFATILGLFIVFIIFRLEKMYDIEKEKKQKQRFILKNQKQEPVLKDESSIKKLVWTVRRVLIILILIVIICIICLPFVDTIIKNDQRTFFIVFYLICLSIWGIIEMTVSVTKLIFEKSLIGMWEFSMIRKKLNR